MQAQNTKYGLQKDPSPQIGYSETPVVNITDDDVEFQIATGPGSRPRFYRLAPFGHPGDTTTIQSGYAKPFLGAGQKHLMTPIIERITKQHVAPQKRLPDKERTLLDTPRLPRVVDADKAPAARAAWLAAKDHAKTITAPRQVVELQIPTAPAPAQAPVLAAKIPPVPMGTPAPADFADDEEDVAVTVPANLAPPAPMVPPVAPGGEDVPMRARPPQGGRGR